MKKQIFILVMGVFATVATAFGQTAVHGIDPTAVTCPTDASNPIAGRPYDYSAIISPPAGVAYWYATKAKTFITAGVRVAGIEIAAGPTTLTGTNYMSNATGATSPNKTTVTWTSTVLAGVDATTNPLFMVVEYTGPGTPACPNNNIKVIQITPKIAFTVDIASMNNTTPFATALIGDATIAQCFDVVQSSMWNGTAIVNDYGTNTLYFEVIAANFSDFFTSTLRLSGLAGTQTATIDWAYTKTPATWTAAGNGGQPGFDSSPIKATVDPSVTSTEKGVSIYVKVTVSNHGYEGLADEPIKLAVEATDATNNKDVLIDCSIGGGYEDFIIQTIKLRPTVTTTPVSITQVP